MTQQTLFDLTGRSALVTGAAGGIGSAVARALATAGAAVLVTDRNGEAAAAVAEKIVADGGSAAARALDVTDRDSAAGAAPPARPRPPREGAKRREHTRQTPPHHETDHPPG